MTELILKGFPIPPSINAQFIGSGRGQIIKSPAARLFDSHVQIYRIKNLRILNNIMVTAHNWVTSEGGLSIEVFYVLPKQEVYSKKSEVKQKDQNNFLKSTLDGLAKIIEIDDKFFFNNTCEKLTCNLESDRQAIIKIKPHKPRTYDGLLLEINAASHKSN
jgi:Holliday junction resolvase RusA-like endonuclease